MSVPDTQGQKPIVTNDISQPSTTWTLRFGRRTLEVGPRPIIMGIVNVTPDSFSDGGRFLAPDEAVAHALSLIRDGADLLDIGGESTRPGAAEVPVAKEIERVAAVIRGIKEQSDALVSIDTRKASVARAALDAGADMVNDISALGDPEMGPVVADAGCPIVLMHMQGAPHTMQARPHYDDVVAEVCDFLGQAVARAVAAGIDRDQTIIDPGIGFGKTVSHNLELLRGTRRLASLGRPILIGTSRKSFIGRLLDAEPGERLIGTIASCVWTRAFGAAIFRVHDVADVAAAFQITAAIEHPGSYSQ
jgi:dihydropteroate synthase